LEWFDLARKLRMSIMRPAQHHRHHNRGLTLVEVAMAIAISSVVIAALYQTFHTQQRTYRKQTDMAVMQQSLRASTYIITRELRGAGYDPLNSRRFGFVSQFIAPHNTFNINYATDTNIIAFTVDDDENGTVNHTQAEMIAYRFNAGERTLDRFRVVDAMSPGVWEPIADRVDAVNFVYYNANGARTTDPTAIRYVEVSLLIRSGEKDLQYNNTNTYTNKLGENICPYCGTDHYRRQLWNTTVQMRNFG
jgi:type IV pilus assembly protein PilW